jgi:hypothetical protein
MIYNNRFFLKNKRNVLLTAYEYTCYNGLMPENFWRGGRPKLGRPFASRPVGLPAQSNERVPQAA